MKRLKLLLAALAVLSGCAGNLPPAENEPPESSLPAASGESAPSGGEIYDEAEYIPRSGLLKCSFFDSVSFMLWESAAAEYPSDKKVMCGVVPHHLAAGSMISGFFRAAAKSRSDVETVVVVATSHYRGELFCTSLSGWDSPFGVVETDEDIVQVFREKLGAVCDDERMTADHSASSHIPFIKYYFPEAKTACLLVAPDSSGNVPQRVAETLASIADREKCLFLFSIDFSHYLSSAEADDADKITSAAVAERDLDKIAYFTNDNVDSPNCLGAYVRLSDLLGLELIEADNSNTERVSGVPYSEMTYPEGLTSYFIFMSREN